MKDVVALHRDYGVIVNDETRDGKRYITLYNGIYEKEFQTGGYIPMTEQNLTTVLLQEVMQVVRKAAFFGLTDDQINSLFPCKREWSQEAVDLAKKYREDFGAIIYSDGYMDKPIKERTQMAYDLQNPLLELIGDTWANRFNFSDIVGDILSGS